MSIIKIDYSKSNASALKKEYTTPRKTGEDIEVFYEASDDISIQNAEDFVRNIVNFFNLADPALSFKTKRIFLYFKYKKLTQLLRLINKQRWVTNEDNEYEFSKKIFISLNLVAGEVVPDITPPSAPLNLMRGGVAVTETTFGLEWDASADNIAVVSYNVYVDGLLYANTGSTTTTYNVTGLTSNTSYDFIVTALDAAGNESANSNTLTDSTNAGI